MKVALINPAWSFEGSIYFGCREPHLPLEYGYARALLEAHGHDTTIVDGTLDGLSQEQVVSQVADFAPDIAVVTTAPSYLFWRCAPPELRLPQQLVRDVREFVPRIVAVGPHASTTPAATLRKLGVDAAVMGECEEVLPLLAAPGSDWSAIDSLCTWQNTRPVARGGTHVAKMTDLPALRWPDRSIARHAHHHHRFEAAPSGPGAEMETSRGCP